MNLLIIDLERECSFRWGNSKGEQTLKSAKTVGVETTLGNSSWTRSLWIPKASSTVILANASSWDGYNVETSLWHDRIATRRRGRGRPERLVLKAASTGSRALQWAKRSSPGQKCRSEEWWNPWLAIGRLLDGQKYCIRMAHGMCRVLIRRCTGPQYPCLLEPDLKSSLKRRYWFANFSSTHRKQYRIGHNKAEVIWRSIKLALLLLLKN